MVFGLGAEAADEGLEVSWDAMAAATGFGLKDAGS